MIDVVEQLGLLEDITERKKSAIIRDKNDKESRKENKKGKIDIQKLRYFLLEIVKKTVNP